MKTLFNNLTPRFATRIVEHNGNKFRIHLEDTSNSPCASVGQDWYHSLSIMTADGTFKQITDAKEVGSSVSHYRCNLGTPTDFETLCRDFCDYIRLVY